MELSDKIKSLPDRPGVYLFKGKRGEVLYIGKALSIRKRVQSYFQGREMPPEHSDRMSRLLSQVLDVEVIVTDNELEALVLESTLVKERQPRYNIVLKDDKHYPFLKLDLQDPWPRLQVVRRVKDDKALYFGPYVPATTMWRLLHLINRTFPLRKCPDVRGRRHCLDYHLGRCLGPCEGSVSKAEYDQLVERVRLVLEGRDRELAKQLEGSMRQAAERLEFERAARLRDQLVTLREALAGQKVLSPGGEEQDILGVSMEGSEANIQVLQVRRGRLVGREAFTFGEGLARGPGDLLDAFIRQFYVRRHTVPREILTSHSVEDGEVIGRWLSERAGHRVVIHHPRRGRKARLVELAVKNAQIALMASLKSAAGRRAALQELQEALGLGHPPHRVEAFDISNIQGMWAVGSQVVFEDALPNRSQYKRYRIKTVAGADDYAMLEEVLRRRFARALESPLPDLILVDGGRGQLNVALTVARELGHRDLPIIALAKEEETIHQWRSPVPMTLPETSRARHVLQQLRDEAHRFAITYHKRLRAKQGLVSILEEIPGVGEKRRQALLRHFGSLKVMQQASIEDIRKAGGLPSHAAAAVHDFVQALTE
ncbi:MAG: excinuclease ABC subunit UvrC [candidate division NC10 bacterium]|nr:excinuclease ABC subunit UvrC [candidate division NC10 bacterium]